MLVLQPDVGWSRRFFFFFMVCYMYGYDFVTVQYEGLVFQKKMGNKKKRFPHTYVSTGLKKQKQKQPTRTLTTLFLRAQKEEVGAPPPHKTLDAR